jgi:hypothetical protein
MRSQLFLVSLVACATLYYGGCSAPLPNVYPRSHQTEFLRYDQGNTQLVLRAYGVGSNSAAAVVDAQKAALETALFTGCTNVIRLVTPDQRAAHDSLFYSLFRDMYETYISRTNEGDIDPDSRMKTESGDVKLAVTVVVRVEQLKSDLRSQGVIKSGY